jgi:signal transduction histidine kinase
MKEKYFNFIFISLIFVILFASIFNSFTRYEYDLGILKFLKYSRDFTMKEKEWINKHQALEYLTDNNYPPYINQILISESEGYLYNGVLADFINYLSLELGLNIYIKSLNEYYSNNSADIYDSLFNKSNNNNLLTNNIFNIKSVLVVKNNEKKIKSLYDLKGDNIAIFVYNNAKEHIKNKLKDYVNFIDVNDINEALNLLLNDKIMAIIADEPVLNHFIFKEKNNDISQKIKIIDQAIISDNMQLIVSENNPVLVNILNKGIFKLKRKNIIKNLEEKWFGFSVSSERDENVGKIVFVFILLLLFSILIFIMFYFWNDTLQIEVKNRTIELLIKSKELQTTFDSINELMVVINDKYQIENINKSFADFINRDRKSLIGSDCRDSIPIFNHPKYFTILNESLKDFDNKSKRYNYYNKIFEVTIYPIYYEKKSVNRVLFVLKDVTNELISEQHLIHSNKMEAIGKISAGVAHEIKNPLGLIRSYIYLLKNSTSGDDLEYISNIEKSAEKISDIINNLLEFSSINNNNNKKEWINIYKYILNIINIERKIFKDSNINYVINGDLKLNCLVNKGNLEHILINLISNSVDAMPEGGNLIINFELSYNNFLLIKVEDNGKGIPAEYLDDIFNPFFTTKKTGNGTGLGLYIVYDQIKKLGGEISVKSQVNKGTIFNIHIPTYNTDQLVIVKSK